MQDLWLDYGRDPEHGLRRTGWGTYGMGKAVVLDDVDEPVEEIDLDQLDRVCSTLPVLN